MCSIFSFLFLHEFKIVMTVALWSSPTDDNIKEASSLFQVSHLSNFKIDLSDFIKTKFRNWAFFKIKKTFYLFDFPQICYFLYIYIFRSGVCGKEWALGINPNVCVFSVIIYTRFSKALRCASNSSLLFPKIPSSSPHRSPVCSPLSQGIYFLLLTLHRHGRRCWCWHGRCSAPPHVRGRVCRFLSFVFSFSDCVLRKWGKRIGNEIHVCCLLISEFCEISLFLCYFFSVAKRWSWSHWFDSEPFMLSYSLYPICQTESHPSNRSWIHCWETEVKICVWLNIYTHISFASWERNYFVEWKIWFLDFFPFLKASWSFPVVRWALVWLLNFLCSNYVWWLCIKFLSSLVIIWSKIK